MKNIYSEWDNPSSSLTLGKLLRMKKVVVLILNTTSFQLRLFVKSTCFFLSNHTLSSLQKLIKGKTFCWLSIFL